MCNICNSDNYRFTLRTEVGGRVAIRNVCESCAEGLTQCANCSEWHDTGGDYCFQCASSMHDCARCGGTFHRDNLYDTVAGYLCYSCERARLDEAAPIKRWDWRPEEFAKHGDGGLYFGLEIEAEVQDDYTNEYAEMLLDQFSGYFSRTGTYFQHDGSLNNGFEVVTMPSTLSYFRGSGLDKVLAHMRKDGCRSHNTSTCGLHVHVDNTTIDRGHAERINYVVHRLQSFMEVVARRTRSNWARYKTPEFSTYNEEKYEAVNFMHRNSIELRIFKGTLNWDTILATVSFVGCVVEFTRGLSRGWLDSQQTAVIREKLVEFCLENGNDELKTYFSERDITNE
jgi:hypothetical protein